MKKFTGQSWLIFLGGFLLALACRSIDLSRSLWLDELHTSWVVFDDWHDILPRCEAGNQNPLYFWLNRLVVSVVGHTEFGLRCLSVTCGSLLVGVAGLWLYRLSQSWLPACVLTLLLAFDPYLIEYSQEARPYALLQLIGLLQVVCFFYYWNVNPSTERGAGSRAFRCIFIALSIISFYIHLTGVLLTFGLLTYGFMGSIWSGARMTKRHGRLVLDGLAIFVGCLPMLPSILAIAARRENWELFVSDNQFNPSLEFQLLVYFVVPGGLFVVMRIVRSFVKKQLSNSSLPEINWMDAGSIYFLVVFAAPVGLAWLLLKLDVAALYLTRYFLTGWIGIMLFAGWQLHRLSFFFESMESSRDNAGADSERQGSLNSPADRSPIAKHARNRMLLVNLALATLVIGNGIYQNHLLWHFARHRQLSMPFASSWRETVDFLDQQTGPDSKEPKLLFLMPNLIEDQHLNDPTPPAPPAGSVSLAEYCQFPVRGIYYLSAFECLPKPTLDRPRFDEIDVQRIRGSSDFWLLVRGNNSIVSDILNELADIGIDAEIPLRLKQVRPFKIRGAEGNRIYVIRFKVLDRDGNQPVP